MGPACRTHTPSPSLYPTRPSHVILSERANAREAKDLLLLPPNRPPAREAKSLP